MNIKAGINNLRFSIYHEGNDMELNEMSSAGKKIQIRRVSAGTSVHMYWMDEKVPLSIRRGRRVAAGSVGDRVHISGPRYNDILHDICARSSQWHVSEEGFGVLGRLVNQGA